MKRGRLDSVERILGLIGGDRRQAELARLLAEDGNTVFTAGLSRWREEPDDWERAAGAPAVILPLPLCKEEGVLNCEGAALPTAELFTRFCPEQRLLAGQVRPAQRQEAEALGLTVEDYFQREEFTVANAALTAEGAVQTAMERLEKTLLQMDCLVLGFGRIGKLLSCRLHGLGAHVTVAARSSVDRAWARAYGWEALGTSALEGRLCSFSAVFNTVPAMVLDASLLCQLPRSCLLVDLASQPGIDSDAASELGIPHVWARGLPGKLTPVAAASALRDAVYYILMEG